MRFLSLLGLLLTFIAPALMTPVFAQDRPGRVVSLNMCTDQLVLALADPQQIVGLSRFAGHPRLSFAAAQAAAYLQLPAAAEAVIALEPDLVVAGLFTDTATKQMLVRFGYRMEEVTFIRSLDDARMVITDMAALLGHPQRGADLIAQIDQALEEAAASPSLTALVVRRRGYTTGTASLAGDLLGHLGIELASEELVGARGGFADLETIVRAQPDVLIMASLEPDLDDQGSAFLVHPALAERYPASRRIAVPERLLLCAGPSLIEAIRHIARERDAALERLATLDTPAGG